MEFSSSDFDREELVDCANGRMTTSAKAIMQLAGALVTASRGVTVHEAVGMAKAEWIRLVNDPALAAEAARPPQDQAAAQLVLRRLGDRQ